ncbi:hypothetical protein D3C80_2219850 [compost metagenome]
MQGEQADPASGVDGVLVWMVAVHRDLVGNVVENDDSVEQHDPHEDKNAQSEVVEHDVLS